MAIVSRGAVLTTGVVEVTGGGRLMLLMLLMLLLMMRMLDGLASLPGAAHRMISVSRDC